MIEIPQAHASSLMSSQKVLLSFLTQTATGDRLPPYSHYRAREWSFRGAWALVGLRSLSAL